MTPPPRMTATGFPAALAFLRQGDTAAAEATCLAILKQDPRHFDALHLAGMIATHAGRLDEGVSLLRRAKAINPRNATLFFNLGLALVRQGNKAEALAILSAPNSSKIDVTGRRACNTAIGVGVAMMVVGGALLFTPIMRRWKKC